jgi:hypothetical protein
MEHASKMKELEAVGIQELGFAISASMHSAGVLPVKCEAQKG